VRRELPSGQVTLLFTDVEGSTLLLHELGAAAYARALAEHQRILRDAFVRHGGVEVDTQGDAFFVVFSTAPGAVRAAAEGQHALEAGPIRVRMGLHTGTPFVTGDGYVGLDVHRAARIAAAGHGGQVLVSASTAELVTDRLRDLGEHRLKDLSEPERIFQVGDEEFPPLRTLFQSNLPIPATSFMGRERELRDVLALLSRPDIRLLTLVGPGGTGKTRLAAEAARLSEDFPDGVWWVPLEALRDPDLVMESVARVVGARDALDMHIGDRKMLIVLDNFEQVVAAAPAVAALMSSCPSLDLLVTSREPLHITGEQEYPVLPLAHEEGVAFFLARASAVVGDMQMDDAVPEICRRLDELPLALELAAARMKALSPTQILQRLEHALPLLTGGARDLPERQRTLRATIDWSHGSLTEQEQQIFRRLAVFRGGCTLDSANAIADADVDTLQSLVDKSLLRSSDERFGMLETIRDFAGERLEASGEAIELRRRHAEHFLALAEEAEPHTVGAHAEEWIDRLESEHDNLRAAIEMLEAMAEGQLVQRMAGAVWGLWFTRGYFAEGGRRLEAALHADESPTAARTRTLHGAMAFAQVRGDFTAAMRWGQEALELSRRLGDAFGTAFSTFVLGHAAKEIPDWPAAHQRFDESLRAFRGLGDAHYTLLARHSLALASFKLGDGDRALALTEENLHEAKGMGNERMTMTSLAALGLYTLDRGRVDEALPLLAESVRIWRTHVRGHPNEVAFYLCSFARAAAITGRPDAAVTLLSAVRHVTKEIGAVEPSYVSDLNRETLDMIHRQLDAAAFDAAWEQGRELTLDEAASLALAIAQ
jgi:predicted ATPase/class 3 adenylate cyclase